MFTFLKLIEPTQIAIELQIGVGNGLIDCNELMDKPEFSKYMQLFGPKIESLHIVCSTVNSKKFYNAFNLLLEKLLYLSVVDVDDKV